MSKTKEGTEKKIEANKNGIDRREEEKECKETQGKSAFFSVGGKSRK